MDYTPQFPNVPLSTLQAQYSMAFPVVQEEPVMFLLKWLFVPLLGVINLLVIILLIRNQFLYLELCRRRKYIADEVHSLLVELVYADWNGSLVEARIREFKQLVPFHRKWCRDFIADRILHMNQVFHVDNQVHRSMYRMFGFERLTYQLLKHPKWYHRSAAIYNLQQMMDDSKRGQLMNMLASDHAELRSNALIALVTLNPDKFTVLLDYDEPLSRADEMKLLDIIYQSAASMPKKTVKLLDSANTSVVVLGIKLFELYQVKPPLKIMRKLIWYSNFRIRKAAVHAVGSLGIVQANALLVTHYAIEQHASVRIAIIRSLGHIGNAKSSDFLKELIMNDMEIDVLFEVTKAIHKLDPGFFMGMGMGMVPMGDTRTKMIRHVQGPLLI